METPAPPVTNERGERLVAFHPAQGPAPPTTTDFALALSARQSNVLLVRSTHRGVWELPGGWVEPDESALDCALRELQEEAGIRSARLSLQGWIVIESSRPARTLTGAVFYAEIDGVPAAVPGDEIAAAAEWPVDALPPDTSAIDAWLVGRLARPE